MKLETQIAFVLFVLILFSLPVFAFAGDISQIIFTNEPRAVKPNEAALLTIQLQYTGDSHPTACMEMFTNSSTGEFSSSNTNWKKVDKLTINSNWTNKNFYYKDSTVGNYTLTVKGTSASCSLLIDQVAQWTAEQDIVVSNTAESTTPESTSTPSTPEPTPGVGSVSWPVEPQIYANAGKDKTVIVGADVYFSGQALGIEKEPLENARYLWNFGDGAIAENQNVKHFYKYPGEYIAVLDVASGKFSTSDNLLVKAIPNQLKISEANKDFIKLFNESNVTLDISGWFLKVESKTFKFPESTLIKANSNLIIPSSNSGLEAINSNSVELLYSNGSKAFFWQKPSELKLTTVVDSKEIVVKPQISSPNNSTSSEQTASVITVSKDDFWTPKKWWGLAVLVAILSGTGFLFIRRKLL